MAKLSRNQARKRKHLRIRNKISGTSSVPRMNVFKSLKNFEAQLIDDTQGKTLIQSSTLKLKIKNGGNIAAATAIGKDMAQKMQQNKINKVVFDRSGYIYHGRVKAFVEALRAEGVKI